MPRVPAEERARRPELRRERFAPSPTGDLHLGGAYIAFVAFLRARAHGGTFLVRMEDLDPPRVVRGAADRILDDLAWLGLEWDEGVRIEGPHAPYLQSLRASLYEDAIARLDALGLVYPCTCTRAEIAASAPHAGEEGPRYPGTCRDPKNRKSDRPASLRLRVPDDERRLVTFHDDLHGSLTEDVAETVGDFVLRRADGIASYQLAVAYDDAVMAIDGVVRGDDLLSSTARQVLIMNLLGMRAPRYLHLPMVLAPDGTRLAKRHQSRWSGSTIAELRDASVDRCEILGVLAHAVGIRDSEAPLDVEEAIALARNRAPMRTSPWTPPLRWVRPKT